MQKILLVVLIVIAIFSCRTGKIAPDKGVIEKTTPNEKTTSNLNGNWQLQMLFASDNNWQRPPVLNINLKELTFSGNSGCNSIRGKFTLKENYIGFDKNIMSTKMACADAKANSDEQAFLAALLKINTFTISKDVMELGQGDIILMKFKEADPMPLQPVQ